MRSLLIACAVLGLTLVPSVSNAAGEVPKATLERLGLVAMQPMTDIQAANVRGSGFVRVSGSSFALSVTGAPYLKVQGSPAIVAGSTSAISFSGIAFAVAGGGAVAYAK